MRLKGEILFLLLCFIVLNGCIPLGRVVTVTIPEIGTSVTYDPETLRPIDITDEFPTTTPQLTVYFSARTDMELEITYRWYHEGSLIAEFTVPLDKGVNNFAWLNSKEPFPAGDYRVEIVSGTMVLREVTFRVVEK